MRSQKRIKAFFLLHFRQLAAAASSVVGGGGLNFSAAAALGRDDVTEAALKVAIEFDVCVSSSKPEHPRQLSRQLPRKQQQQVAMGKVLVAESLNRLEKRIEEHQP